MPGAMVLALGFQALKPESLYFFGLTQCEKIFGGMAGVAGLEPVTSGVTGRRSNQLSYTPIRDRGRLATPSPAAKSSTPPEEREESPRNADLR